MIVKPLSKSKHKGLERAFFKSGDVILDRESRLNGVYYIEEGLVSHVSGVAGMGVPRIMHYHSQGEIIGLDGWLNSSQGVKYVAVMDSTLKFISNSRIEVDLDINNMLLAAMLKYHRLEREMVYELTMPTLIRATVRLIRLAQESGVEIEPNSGIFVIKILLSNRSIIQYTGTSESTIARVLINLKEYGALTRLNQVLIINTKKVRQYIDKELMVKGW